ncbi:MAG: hypothetical protein KDE46_27530 [Caldilineaceae bacterium]|nr:hypothetical protein [Caldilineaceae bacterium]MCB9147743.1 hypothetical protein [Caldilineaceae bacterium]
MLTISSAIEESAESVKAAVKESANSQIDEMRRIALENQLATKQSSLQSIQKEIRELDRTNTKGMYKWQIKEWKKQRHGLREEESKLIAEIRRLQIQIDHKSLLSDTDVDIEYQVDNRLMASMGRKLGSSSLGRYVIAPIVFGIIPTQRMTWVQLLIMLTFAMIFVAVDANGGLVQAAGTWMFYVAIFKCAANAYRGIRGAA